METETNVVDATPAATLLREGSGVRRCFFCEEEIEVDSLWSDVDGAILDWQPCCEDARYYVDAEGWEDFAGESMVDSYNRSTGGRATATVESGEEQIAVHPLAVKAPGAGVDGWRAEVFADVDRYHSHHKAPKGWLRGVAVYNGPLKVGVAVLSRPVARMIQERRPEVAEVTRVCVWGNTQLRRNACSKLYSVCGKQARALGYRVLITYTLEEESGESLKAAGFLPVHRTRGGSWNRKGRARTDKAPTTPKIRWEKNLTKTARIGILAAHTAFLESEVRREARLADKIEKAFRAARRTMKAERRASEPKPTPTPPASPPQNDHRARMPVVRVGLPYASRGTLLEAAQDIGGHTLLSAGAMHRQRRGKGDTDRPWAFTRIGDAAWMSSSALDSAGFVAMMQGGYRWSVEEYVGWVCTLNGDDNAGRAFPFGWWSAMDFCCEPEIASDRAEVEKRIRATVDSYRQTLEALNGWRDEGVTDVPDPMPILQGRTADDYVGCAHELARVISESSPCTCPDGDEWCAAEWHRTHKGLPALVGLGSVCRRNLHGPEGLLTILEALDKALPAHVRLHLFGVKGDSLPHIAARFAHRIESIDSMAWDLRARKEARAARISNTVEHRAEWMKRWHDAQTRKLRDPGLLPSRTAHGVPAPFLRAGSRGDQPWTSEAT